MAQYVKKVLSGSTNGKPLYVLGATTSGGTLLHTALSATGDNQADEVWLWAYNTNTTTAQITVSFGGTPSGDRMIYSVPAQDGYYMVCPGLVLNGGLVVRAHASASNQVAVVGYVNQVVT